VDWEPSVKVCTCKNLDLALVQWQKMAVREYKNTEVAKIQDPQKFPPSKV
jgi:hypothetical protein